ncbi:hypothetical protein L6273_02500, partial [Candidatus Parcubacteria bacterium]|nr:hypothetical protein [Candidatus Parcubacteria bacterium]
VFKIIGFFVLIGALLGAGVLVKNSQELRKSAHYGEVEALFLPDSRTISKGDSLTSTFMLDTKENKLTAVDVRIKYNKNVLRAVNVTPVLNGSGVTALFASDSDVLEKVISHETGTIGLVGISMETDENNMAKGVVSLFKIEFEAIANGSSDITLDPSYDNLATGYNPDTSDQDLKISSVKKAVYTVGNESVPTNTPVPIISTNTPVSTRMPTKVPTKGPTVTGKLEPTTKPIANGLLWYSTLDDIESISNPNIGNTYSIKTLSATDIVTAKYGNGLKVTSSNDYFEIRDTASFNGTNGSMEFWFKPNWDHTDDTGHRLFEISNYTDNDSLSLTKVDSSGSYRLIINGNQGADNYFNLIVESGNYQLSSGLWAHFRITWDANAPAGETLRLFINGTEPIHSSNDDFKNTFDADPIRIFFYGNNKTDHADGTYDEIKIFGGSGGEPGKEPTKIPTKKPTSKPEPTKKSTVVPTVKSVCGIGEKKCDGDSPSVCVNGRWIVAIAGCECGCDTGMCLPCVSKAPVNTPTGERVGCVCQNGVWKGLVGDSGFNSDVNCNGSVDYGDFNDWRMVYFDNAPGDKMGVDFDCNGVVDYGDFNGWRMAYFD